MTFMPLKFGVIFMFWALNSFLLYNTMLGENNFMYLFFENYSPIEMVFKTMSPEKPQC